MRANCLGAGISSEPLHPIQQWTALAFTFLSSLSPCRYVPCHPPSAMITNHIQILLMDIRQAYDSWPLVSCWTADLGNNKLLLISVLIQLQIKSEHWCCAFCCALCW